MLTTKYSGIKNEQKSSHYLQELTVLFYWNIMVPTQRSVNNFGLLIFLFKEALVTYSLCQGINTSTDFLDFAFL